MIPTDSTQDLSQPESDWAPQRMQLTQALVAGQKTQLQSLLNSWPKTEQTQQQVKSVLSDVLDTASASGRLNEPCVLLVAQYGKNKHPVDPSTLSNCIRCNLARVLEVLLSSDPSSACSVETSKALLSLAIAQNSTSCVKVLLRHASVRESVLQADAEGFMPLVAAVRTQNLKMIDLLLPYSDELARDPLNGAHALLFAVGGWGSEAKKYPIVQRLANPHSARASSKNGITPLMAVFGQPDTTRLLQCLIPLSDLRAQDHQGETPLMKAARNNQFISNPEASAPEFVLAMEALFEGSDLHQQDQNGKTAWAWVVEGLPKWAAHLECKKLIGNAESSASKSWGAETDNVCGGGNETARLLSQPSSPPAPSKGAIQTPLRVRRRL